MDNFEESRRLFRELVLVSFDKIKNNTTKKNKEIRDLIE